MSMAFENVIRASHLNVMKYIANATGSQMSMQASLFSRLGKTDQHQDLYIWE